MTSQLTIFDVKAGRERRDAAIQQVALTTDPGWRKAADWAVAHLAASNPTVTTDDVWQLLHDWAIPSPLEPRALGAVMVRAASKNLLTATDRIIQSQRPECHCRPVRVWRSLVADLEPSTLGVDL